MFSLAISSMPSCWRASSAADGGGEFGVGLGQRGGEEALQAGGGRRLVHGGFPPGAGRVLYHGRRGRKCRRTDRLRLGMRAGAPKPLRVARPEPRTMSHGRFPVARLRRNRHDAWTRRLVAENRAVGR